MCQELLYVFEFWKWAGKHGSFSRQAYKSLEMCQETSKKLRNTGLKKDKNWFEMEATHYSWVLWKASVKRWNLT